MKTPKNILALIIFSLIWMLTSCGGGIKQEGKSPKLMPTEHGAMSEMNGRGSTSDDIHEQHNSLINDFSHKDIVILEHPYQPTQEIQVELEQVIDAYLRIEVALIKGDEQGVNNSVDVMANKIMAVQPTQLFDKGSEAWKNHQAFYKSKLKEMRHITGLENKRSYFSHLSEIMYCTIKSFGLKQGKLFAIYCPMALDNKGAYWISDSKTIKNPYMGEKMLTCGEIKEEL
nr:DUF3347 domain-containing protein [uncultured Carboxylicivirga sp.]